MLPGVMRGSDMRRRRGGGGVGEDCGVRRERGESNRKKYCKKQNGQGADGGKR